MPTTIFCAGTSCQNLAQIFDEPILRGDRARRRRDPVLVEVHEDDGVAFFAEEFVIVSVVARGQFDHELEANGVERRARVPRRIRGSAAWIWSGIDSKSTTMPDLVGLDGVFDDIANEVVARVRIRQQLRPFR